MTETIAIIGLGYVGLPVAIAMAKKFPSSIGFDISEKRVASLQSGQDWTGEISDQEMAETTLKFTCDPADLANCSFLIVTVPTPIDSENRPDLSPIKSACKLIAPHLRKGAIIVFESTVYPGVTDDVAGPLLEAETGMKRGVDFKLGYSPERINPGDKVHRLETITKIVSAEDEESLERVKAVYGAIIEAGLHVASSIKVAEAAKVIENTQRDVNIALMNELALIFDRMDIQTSEVLAAAGTKWNFLPFTPGLVGGHCIGVDPYYLTCAAERHGYRAEVILSGRRINDDMGKSIGRKTIKLMIKKHKSLERAKVGIFGLTFKEDVPDLRNSKVPDIITELREYGVEPIIHDPMANAEEAQHEYGLTLSNLEDMKDLDALILAVNHKAYRVEGLQLCKRLSENAVVIDVKSMLNRNKIPKTAEYWSL